MAQHMLTTMDNPHSPWTQWDDWFAFDERIGYHTSAYLARIQRQSDDMSEADQEVALEDAVLEAVRMNITGNYIMVPDPNKDASTT